MRVKLVFASVAGFLAVSTSALPAAGDPSPRTVSPGETEVVSWVGHPCPTFSWGTDPRTEQVELVVYRLGVSAEVAVPVLEKTLTGNATSWTPTLESCLERGARYAWSVRATRGEGASQWSTPRLFQIVAGPTREEFEEALALVRDYLSAEGSPERATETDATLVGNETAPAALQPGTSVAPPGTQLSVDGNVDAVSFSGDGSLLSSLDPSKLSGPVPVNRGGTGATTAADARGQLDAAASTHSHPFSDLTDTLPGGKLSGTYAEPLSLTNAANSFTGDGSGLTGLDPAALGTGTGAIDISGNAATATDAGTLDGLDSTAFATAASLGSHVGNSSNPHGVTLDQVTPTLALGDLLVETGATVTRLARGSDGQFLQSDSTAVTGLRWAATPETLLPGQSCPGGTYLVGLNGDGSLRCDGVEFFNKTGAVDVAGPMDQSWVGQNTAIAIGADGFPIISYEQKLSNDLKVAHCRAVDCDPAAGFTLTVVDDAESAGLESDVAIGVDGLPIISYWANSASATRVAHCNAVDCNSTDGFTVTFLGSGNYPAIAIGLDGLPIISYHKFGDLEVAHCNAADCNSTDGFMKVPVDTTDDVGRYTSIAIGSDGLPIISYRNYTSGELMTAHCWRRSCDP